jgi:hypothetical protein
MSGIATEAAYCTLSCTPDSSGEPTSSYGTASVAVRPAAPHATAPMVVVVVLLVVVVGGPVGGGAVVLVVVVLVVGMADEDDVDVLLDDVVVGTTDVLVGGTELVVDDVGGAELLLEDELVVGDMLLEDVLLVVTAVDVVGATEVVETNVDIKTPDGTCDAAFIHPATGSHPAVIIWPDAFGLRPSLREMGRRLAGSGYSVLVVNPFYRVAKAPVVEDASNFNFSDPPQRAKLTPLMGSIGADGAVEKDAPAFVAWLDSQRQVDKNKKIGTQGYCMGGPLVVKTAAAISWSLCG